MDLILKSGFPPRLPRARHRRIEEYAGEMKFAPTPAEATFWEELAPRLAPRRVKRQVATNIYIIDFVIPEYRLAIEIDGLPHLLNRQVRRRDSKKEHFLTAHGFKLVRFTNWQVLEAPERVLDLVLSACN